MLVTRHIGIGVVELQRSNQTTLSEFLITDKAPYSEEHYLH